MSSTPPVLEISGLNVNYGLGEKAVHAVRDINLTLHRGEVLGLAGESGSGKSTLAYAVTRLLSPPGVITGGEVRYHPRQGTDIDILSLDSEQLRAFRWSEISLVFQGAMNSLNPVHTVRSQLTDVLKAHRPDMTSAQRQERAASLLSLVGISADRLASYPHQLSGGMRQRVMIAMALALDPEIVILDEPTTALDVVMQRQILKQLSRLRNELDFSVVFITHDISLLIEFSDRIAIMYGGRIVEEAAAKEIYQTAHHPYSHGLLHSFPALHGPRRELTGIPGSPPDLTAMPPGCAFHPRCPKAFEPCDQRVPALEPVPGDGSRTVACWLHADH
ncbi:ATP-binding cassette domain-containing protein [Streptomyces sp. 3MP-14]|uniref:ATP-binding cassette domain-containing protein n=1 Tax=Streptomyces mimosae TaxID=2586635 RepID=A0A5N5ZZD1_9ACTN|nr:MULTISPECIES: ABC transporter ATP-binding protein [Streptomyces]KAB8161173.1 ATP-binding cassette domain-containing protein [Streptomyces mimosae]KAB8178984.1 ATP-binding cassette domain-containing protein [Streptomyces sp. 3MP-14]